MIFLVNKKNLSFMIRHAAICQLFRTPSLLHLWQYVLPHNHPWNFRVVSQSSKGSGLDRFGSMAAIHTVVENRFLPPAFVLATSSTSRCIGFVRLEVPMSSTCMLCFHRILLLTLTGNDRHNEMRSQAGNGRTWGRIWLYPDISVNFPHVIWAKQIDN
jgi:hypothetical protein